jgi:hypothetical protein
MISPFVSSTPRARLVRSNQSHTVTATSAREPETSRRRSMR